MDWEKGQDITSIRKRTFQLKSDFVRINDGILQDPSSVLSVNSSLSIYQPCDNKHRKAILQCKELVDQVIRKGNIALQLGWGYLKSNKKVRDYIHFDDIYKYSLHAMDDIDG